MTNNKQQTAVEWLQSIELERDLTLADWALAKEMEQNQITLAHIDAAIFTEWGKNTDARKNADQYYEQTYGGGEQ